MLLRADVDNLSNLPAHFALEDNEMYMVMPRRYNIKKENKGPFVKYKIADLTTYIEPSKFNYMFAQTSLDKLGIDLVEFELKNLDTMREKILQYTGYEPFNFGNGTGNSIKIEPS